MIKTQLIVLLILMAFVAVSCTPADQVEEQNERDEIHAGDKMMETSVVENKQMDKDDSMISLEEIEEHSSPESCWMSVQGKVYDVTDFLADHPGGAAILKGCGKEATDIFNGVSKHSDKARGLLEEYYIGDLE